MPCSTLYKGDVMKIRITFFLPIMFLASSVSANAKKPPYEMSNGIKYGVAYCLSQTYLNTEFSSDSRHISGTYIQLGSYGLQVYQSIRDYVDTYKKNKYPSKHNNNLDIMQCIDLFDSSKLREVIEKSANSIP